MLTVPMPALTLKIVLEANKKPAGGILAGEIYVDTSLVN